MAVPPPWSTAVLLQLPREDHQHSRVLDLLTDLQRLAPVPRRLLDLAEIGVGVAQVAEGVPLALAVADLAGDDQRLLEVLDRLLDLAQFA